MIARPFPLTASTIAGLLFGLAASPAWAAPPAQARLVHCGQDTCLRLFGRRQHPTVAVRIGGHDLPVEGGRAWRITVPLATARGWTISSGSLNLTLADPRADTESTSAVILPPGALGRPVELAMMVVRAR